MFLYKPTPLWLLETPQEEQLPAAYYVGQARRSTSPDAATDRRIALLEAAARLSTPMPPSFFLDVIRDPREAEIVRWTALRLLGNTNPEATRSIDLDVSTSVLLASRLDLIRRGVSGAVPPPPTPQQQP